MRRLNSRSGTMGSGARRQRERPGDVEAGPARHPSGLEHADQQRGDAGRERAQPGVVDHWPPAVAWAVDQAGGDEGHGDDAERQVDVEHPAPRRVIGQQTADERTTQ
jgi:hypothetical protein